MAPLEMEYGCQKEVTRDQCLKVMSTSGSRLISLPPQRHSEQITD